MTEEQNQSARPSKKFKGGYKTLLVYGLSMTCDIDLHKAERVLEQIGALDVDREQELASVGFMNILGIIDDDLGKMAEGEQKRLIEEAKKEKDKANAKAREQWELNDELFFMLKCLKFYLNKQSIRSRIEKLRIEFPNYNNKSELDIPKENGQRDRFRELHALEKSLDKEFNKSLDNAKV